MPRSVGSALVFSVQRHHPMSQRSARAKVQEAHEPQNQRNANN